MKSTTNIEVTTQGASTISGIPSTKEYVVTFYTENTRKGVGRDLSKAVRAWARWFRSQGATSCTLVTKRPQYHYSYGGGTLLGTFWAVRVKLT